MLNLLGLDGLTGLLAGAAAIVALIFGAFMRGRKSQRDDTNGQNAIDTLGRVSKGRDAVRDGRDLDPGDRLRANDGRW